MRYKKHALIARRNKILPINFVRQDMTTYSGLTLIDHYLRLYRIHTRTKQAFKAHGFTGDYSIGDVLFILLIMLLVVPNDSIISSIFETILFSSV